MNEYLNKTEKELDSMMDFKFEFEIDIFYLLRTKRWIKRKLNALFGKKKEKDFLSS